MKSLHFVTSSIGMRGIVFAASNGRPCFNILVNRAPRFNKYWVVASKSDPNWAKAATSPDLDFGDSSHC